MAPVFYWDLVGCPDKPTWTGSFSLTVPVLRGAFLVVPFAVAVSVVRMTQNMEPRNTCWKDSSLCGFLFGDLLLVLA